MTDYTVRSMKIKTENIERLNEIKEKSGRTQQWVINAALEYFFENEWDYLTK